MTDQDKNKFEFIKGVQEVKLGNAVFWMKKEEHDFITKDRTKGNGDGIQQSLANYNVFIDHSEQYCVIYQVTRHAHGSSGEIISTQDDGICVADSNITPKEVMQKVLATASSSWLDIRRYDRFSLQATPKICVAYNEYISALFFQGKTLEEVTSQIIYDQQPYATCRQINQPKHTVMTAASLSLSYNMS